MSKSKHTPGPWNKVTRTQKRFNSKTGERQKDDVTHFIENSFKIHIALVSEFREEHEANAHLIAAAPELLESLKRICGAVDSCQTSHLSDDPNARTMDRAHLERMFELALEVIAKAEGKVQESTVPAEVQS